MKVAIAILVLVCLYWQIDARAVVVTGRVLNADGLEEREELCITELNLDREKIINLNKQHNPDRDEDFYNFTACSFKKLGLMNEDGEIDYDQLEKYILEVTKSERPENPVALKMFENMVSTSINECSKDPPATTHHGDKAIETLGCISNGMKEGLRRLVV